MRYIVVLFIISSLYSCDYSTIKKENEELKVRNNKLEALFEEVAQQQAENEYKQKHTKYAFIYIKYKLVRDGTPVLYLSDIFTIPKHLEEDDKYKIMDKYENRNVSGLFDAPIILSREFLIFNSYAEASEAKMRKST